MVAVYVALSTQVPLNTIGPHISKSWENTYLLNEDISGFYKMKWLPLLVIFITHHFSTTDT